MDIYLTKNNTRSGPFNETRVWEMLQAGLISTRDMAWREGLPQWIPVAQLVQYNGPIPAGESAFQISRGLFRSLTGLSLFFLIAVLVVSFIPLLPEPLKAYEDTRFNTGSPLIPLLIIASMLLLLVLTLVSYVGLFLIHKWGRLLFAIVTGLGIVMELCLGPVVEPAISSALGSLSDMSCGLLIGLSYFTPLFNDTNRA
jgi:hypothetical protein